MKTLVLQTHALHLGYLGCYGNEWVATPNIDRLAQEGVVFDQHYALCPDEASKSDAVRGLAASLGVADAVQKTSGATFEEVSKRIPKAVDDLAEQSLAWADLPSLTPPWEIPADYQDLYLDADGEPWLDPPVGALEDSGGLSRLQNTYAAVITHFDYQIGRLRELLKERWDELAIVLTASCGLALGDHGIVGPHRAWMHEELWHVPLIVRLPEGEQAGRRVRALTQPGDPLWPLLRGEQDKVRDHALGRLRIGNSEETALRSLDWALLLPIEIPPNDPPRAAQLYVKPDDRWEVNDVRHHHLELAEEFERKLRS